LDKEVEYIKNYVSFQRLRKDEKLIVNLCIGKIEAGSKIAPLLLVVLLENAFKFVSSYSDKENKIDIQIHSKANVLHCSLSNTMEIQKETEAGNSGGIGIANLKRRLAILYPGKYELTASSDKEFYKTNLMINLS
jgi:LytS/YehU family sensor histidine kinase